MLPRFPGQMERPAQRGILDKHSAMRRILRRMGLVAVWLAILANASGCVFGWEVLAGGLLTAYVLAEVDKNTSRQHSSKPPAKPHPSDHGKPRAEAKPSRTATRTRTKSRVHMKPDTRHREAADVKRSQIALAVVETELKKGRWSASGLEDFSRTVSVFDRSSMPARIRQRLHLAAGLYAWFVDDHDRAVAEFTVARRLGARDPRLVCQELWTPGALEAFERSAASGD